MKPNVEQSMRDAAITFVDFLYAVVVALVMAAVFDEVIVGPISWYEKLGKIILVIGVFYFIAWDWIHGRLLTFKNPYRGYRRFLIEMLIAFCGYGAARGAVRSEINFVVYLTLILLLGVWWSRVMLFKHPRSRDGKELKFIVRYQSDCAALTSGTVIGWCLVFGGTVLWWFVFPLTALGMLFVFYYELENERPPGMVGGPGVPWFGRHMMARARKALKRGVQ